jgi:hypothetical protein
LRVRVLGGREEGKWQGNSDGGIWRFRFAVLHWVCCFKVTVSWLILLGVLWQLGEEIEETLFYFIIKNVLFLFIKNMLFDL